MSATHTDPDRLHLKPGKIMPNSRLPVLIYRGVLKTGMWADVVVFDPAKITDKALELLGELKSAGAARGTGR